MRYYYPEKFLSNPIIAFKSKINIVILILNCRIFNFFISVLPEIIDSGMASSQPAGEDRTKL